MVHGAWDVPHIYIYTYDYDIIAILLENNSNSMRVSYRQVQLTSPPNTVQEVSCVQLQEIKSKLNIVSV